MDSCIFCRIAAGEIPSKTVYEDADFRAILDINPASRGHVLILPKQHAANIYELPDEMAAKAMVLAKKLAKAIQSAFGCEGLKIVQNNGEKAGQTVLHYHMHLIPCYNGTEVPNWEPQSMTDDELTKVRDAIAGTLQ